MEGTSVCRGSAQQLAGASWGTTLCNHIGSSKKAPVNE